MGQPIMPPPVVNNSAPAPQPQMAPQNMQQTVFTAPVTMQQAPPIQPVKMQMPQDSSTVILDDDTDISQGDGYMQLLSSELAGAPDLITLDGSKQFMTIGRLAKGEAEPDIAFPADFRTIGRRHAQIMKEGGTYYIVDLGSQNHTTLNGEVIAANRKYELTDGSVVGFTVSKPVKYRLTLH